MANIFLPKITLQGLYYYCQLTIITIVIHVNSTDNMMYHEEEGGELIKNLIDRIVSEVTKLQIFATLY